jgi:hypothetical protein
MEANLTSDKKTAILMGWSATQLAIALEAYYQSHQQNGCTCDLCRNAANALASSKLHLAIPNAPTEKMGPDPNTPKDK